MSFLYADASALVRAYLPDERDRDKFRALLLEGDEPVASSAVSRVEFAHAVRAAERAGRITARRELLDRFDADTAARGRIHLIVLRPEVVLPVAYDLVLEHRLRTLDAMHLAVATHEAPSLAGELDVAFVTADVDQAEAARALGLNVR